MPTRALSYTIESRQIEGKWFGFVIARCGACQQPTEVAWKSLNNPNYVTAHFTRLGWHFDPHVVGKCRCPDCNTKISLPTLSKAPDLDTFSGRLRWAREQARISRDDLSAQSGVNRRLCDHLEDGTTSERYQELEVSAGRKFAPVFIAHGVAIDSNWLIGITDDTNVLALNLNRLMIRQSMTDGRLASESGVPITVIQAIRSGALASTLRASDLAEALGVKLEILTGETPKVAAPPAPIGKARIGRAYTITDAIAAYVGRVAAAGLRDAREAKGLSQGDLADLIGQHPIPWQVGSVQSMISKAERGTHKEGDALDLLLSYAALVIENAPIKMPKVNGHQHVLSMLDAETLRATLAKVEENVGELKIMLQKALDDAATFQQMILDEEAAIERVRSMLPLVKSSTLEGTHREHLKLLGGIWYFRRHVPVKAREVFGVSEVFQPLNTADRSEALKLKKPYEIAFDAKLAEFLAPPA